MPNWILCIKVVCIIITLKFGELFVYFVFISSHLFVKLCLFILENLKLLFQDVVRCNTIICFKYFIIYCYKSCIYQSIISFNVLFNLHFKLDEFLVKIIKDCICVLWFKNCFLQNFNLLSLLFSPLLEL